MHRSRKKRNTIILGTSSPPSVLIVFPSIDLPLLDMPSGSHPHSGSSPSAQGSSQDKKNNGEASGTQQNFWKAGDDSNGHGGNGRQGNGESSLWGSGFLVDGDWEDNDVQPKQEEMEEWEEWDEEQDDAVKDYYALLNVPRDATDSRIRSSYYTLSLRFHPDKQPPNRQERTTAHFNNIQVAYETLTDPHKRAIYDSLGVEGLKQKSFEVGVKTMGPEEFKIWLQEQVRKHKVAEVMSLVNSRGDITVALDVSGLQFQEAVEIVGSNGMKRLRFRDMPPVKLTKYIARHSFTVPLESLGKILTAPFANLKGSAAESEPQRKQKVQAQSTPNLTLTAFLGGIPVQAKSHHRAIVASPGLSAQVSHSFPLVHPEAPLSIASVLSGLDIEATSTIFPQRVFSTSVSRNFGSSRLIFKPIFNSSPLLIPPTIETTYAISVGKRGNFFIQYNSGAAAQWPSAISQLLTRPPLTSHLTIGYTMLPIVGTPAVDDDDTGENETPQYLRKKQHGRSKATETWRVTATAGRLVGGGQIGLSWGRTYFIGTPIGLSPIDPVVKARGKPKGEGIKVNVDATVALMGAMVINVRASRNIFTHTKIGLGIGIGGTLGKDGVVLSINWSRLGQRITIPITVAPIPETNSILYGTLVPFVGYALLEGLYLRPRQYRLRRKEVEKAKRQLMVKIAKNRKKAEEMVELMKHSVEISQQRKEEEGGLVIIEAGYGVKRKAGEWSDVTVALAALMDDDQIVIPRGLNKSHITGFYDPAPGEKKELWVKYLYKDKMHDITVDNSHGLVIPMKAHCIE